MSLYDIWREDPSQVRDKRVDQVIGFAGDGKLGDRNSAPSEFRTFLARIPSEMLVRYAEECLESHFPDSGLALQDIANEMGSRIGFEVRPGRYRGTKGEIGYDGIWSGPDGHQIVVEVKTTDAYRLRIETVATYRRELIRTGNIAEDSSSVLLIVGREDTGELEAQIRGSRHAWDVRVISVDALIRLMRIRQEVDDPTTESRIRALLVPHEYTRVDEIIELVFSTAEDLLEETPADQDGLDGLQDRAGSSQTTPMAFNAACAARISAHMGLHLTKQSRITFIDADAGTTITCAVSKEYRDPRGPGYWFSLYPHQLEKLRAAGSAYAAFGCGSPNQIALLPLSFLESQLTGLNRTQTSDDKFYWHIQIQRIDDRWMLLRRKGEEWPDITGHMLFTDGQ